MTSGIRLQLLISQFLSAGGFLLYLMFLQEIEFKKNDFLVIESPSVPFLNEFFSRFPQSGELS